jgi:hypothetical protein
MRGGCPLKVVEYLEAGRSSFSGKRVMFSMSISLNDGIFFGCNVMVI